MKRKMQGSSYRRVDNKFKDQLADAVESVKDSVLVGMKRKNCTFKGKVDEELMEKFKRQKRQTSDQIKS